MASHPNSADLEDYSLVDWLLNLYNSDPVAFLQMDLSQIILELPFPPPLPCPVFQDELHPVQIQPNVQPANVEDGSTIPTARSPPIPLPPTPPPPQPVAFLPPKWHVIPQRPYKRKQWDYKPLQPILFQANGFPGVNMGDMLRKQFATLKGRDDLVMQGAKKAFQCRFWFIGYPQKSFQIFTTYWDKDCKPIPRSKLAYEIARRLKKYLDTMTSSHTIDSPVDRRWEIGEGFMRLDNIFLAKLESATKGSYQALFYVVGPTM